MGNNNGKPKKSELDLAMEIVPFTLKYVEQEWSEAYKYLQEVYKGKFVVVDESMAAFDVTLAVITLELQSLKNIYPEEQAQRLREYILYLFDTEEYGEYALSEIAEYEKAFNSYETTRNYPHDEVAVRLLKRLLGKNISNFSFQPKFSDKKLISPVFISTFSGMLIELVKPNPWKTAHDSFELIPIDIPLNIISQEAAKIKKELTEGKQTKSNDQYNSHELKSEDIIKLIEWLRNEKDNYPVLSRWAIKSPDTLIEQIVSIANAWHNGNIISAAQALESDLEHN